ncbi:hypothetical protein C8Q80DRAFT_491865 [Daedaleopsis nitida]|nr:hypothetical protein C8Q80DRAFT_491865 [Daedaleopsis nitida]
MSRSVSFADGTKPPGTSPTKLYRIKTPHSSTKFDLQLHRAELRFGMHRKITVLEHEKFLDTFFAPYKRRRRFANIFAGVNNSPTVEATMYDDMPDALNKSNICNGFRWVAHPHKNDKADPTQQSVDIGMYPDDHVPPPPTDGSPYPRGEWSRLELGLECKADWIKRDPFDLNSPNDEPVSEERKDGLGQILSYAELVFTYQQRTFFYIIIILGDFARIVRLDRSSVFATVKFNYKEQPEKITEFLWRYCQQNSSQRGHDDTATRIEPSNPLWQIMKEKKLTGDTPASHPEQLFSDSLDEKWPWWELKVNVPYESKGRSLRRQTFRPRRFLVGKPHFQAPGVAGRGTRGYVALPLDSRGRPENKFVYLKDAWRVDHPDIEQEGVTLEYLNNKGVQFVPTLVCHADVPGKYQVTDWRELWGQYRPGDTECPLKRHQHYRLVVKEVGRPLDQFGPSSADLVVAIYCCLHAHRDAYNAGILHRDISAGNMLLYQFPDGTWGGILNDWELSKKIDHDSPEGRQPDRTGTWQFMSAHALNDDKRVIVLADELESVFHVLLYFAIRFLQHNLATKNVGHFLHDYFDAYCSYADGYRCGARKFEAMKLGSIDITSYNGALKEGKWKLQFFFKSAEAEATSQEASDSAAEEPSSERAPSPTGQSSAPDHASSSAQRSSSPFGSDLSSVPPTPPPEDQDQPEERSHPLNHIIDKLLTWFKAYYEEDRSLSQRSKTSDGPGVVPLAASKLLQSLQRRTNPTDRSTPSTAPSGSGPEDAPSAGLAAASEPGPSTTQTRTETAALAKNLTSHDPILKLFDESMGMTWPPDDKGPDKKPKRGYVPRRDQIPTQTELNTSKKRKLAEEEAVKSKKSKVSVQ